MDGRISNFMQIASVRRYEMSEGKERGLKVVDCDNGKIRFLLNESKALDIMQLWHEGQNMSFLSKNGFTAREIPFERRFEGGMLYTCGLDSVGAREGYELHGTFHNIPARVTRAECGEAGLLVEAEIADAALFGKNLVMKRKIFSEIGSERVTVEDILENRGYGKENYCLLYHINVGYPMLDSCARLEDRVNRVKPRTAWAEKNIRTRAEMSVPEAGMEEMCYFLGFSEPRISLVNEKIGKKFTLEWSGDTLPHFVQWKSMASGDYALGLEPCTTELDGNFRYDRLASGESKKFTLAFRVCGIH